MQEQDQEKGPFKMAFSHSMYTLRSGWLWYERDMKGSQSAKPQKLLWPLLSHFSVH